MSSLERVQTQLERCGYTVHALPDRTAAAEHLNRVIDGTTVGFGGSVTLQEMGLYESLGAHNTVAWHWKQPEGDPLSAAAAAEVYLTSVNALAETGEIVNMDGNGNRVASMLYGHRKVFFVIGRNKLAPTLEAAIHRTRNIAAPKNAQRLKRRTPCAIRADRCYHCSSPDRICCAMTILYRPMMNAEAEILLIDEDLGY